MKIQCDQFGQRRRVSRRGITSSSGSVALRLKRHKDVSVHPIVQGNEQHRREADAQAGHASKLLVRNSGKRAAGEQYDRGRCHDRLHQKCERQQKSCQKSQRKSAAWPPSGSDKHQQAERRVRGRGHSVRPGPP